MKIVYDGRTLNSGTGNAFIDGNGCEWMVTSMSGWEAAPQRGVTLEYTMRHGGVTANPTYGPRSLMLSGITKSPNETAFWGAYNSLISSTNALREPRSLVVTEGTVDKSVGVLRASEPRIVILPGHFTWDLSFMAMDPVKYGDAVTTAIAAGGSATITNVGNIEGYYLSAATTAAGLVSLTNNDVRLTTGETGVESGVIFDFRKRTVRTPAGADRYFQLSPASSWWPLEPGDNIVTNGGTAPVSLTYRPSWA